MLKGFVSLLLQRIQLVKIAISAILAIVNTWTECGGQRTTNSSKSNLKHIWKWLIEFKRCAHSFQRWDKQTLNFKICNLHSESNIRSVFLFYSNPRQRRRRPNLTNVNQLVFYNYFFWMHALHIRAQSKSIWWRFRFHQFELPISGFYQFFWIYRDPRPLTFSFLIIFLPQNCTELAQKPEPNAANQFKKWVSAALQNAQIKGKENKRGQKL